MLRLNRHIAEHEVDAVACRGLLHRQRFFGERRCSGACGVVGIACQLGHLGRHEFRLLLGPALLLRLSCTSEQVFTLSRVAGRSHYNKFLEKNRSFEPVLFLHMGYLPFDFNYPAAPGGAEESDYVAYLGHDI